MVATQEDGAHHPAHPAWDENLDVGADTGTPVDDKDYQVPFAFTGSIDKLTLTVDRPELSDADKAKLEAACGPRHRPTEARARRVILPPRSYPA